MSFYLGVDTGGTFTDFVLYDSSTGQLRIHKVLSTPDSPERAILQGIKDLAMQGAELIIVHGSTVATNAVLENKGVRTVYICNEGFADVLNIGRQAREELYNLTPIKKPPVIESELCVELNTRNDSNGQIIQSLDDAALANLIEHIKTLAPRAVAINLLFSYLNDTEELRIAQALEQAFGDTLFISRSSDVLPEYKEYERGITTLLNARVGPLMQGYLNRLQLALPKAQLGVMQSSGGTASIEHAGRYPVHLLLSGPAGGLKAAQYIASTLGYERLLTFDMGGTSTDVSIINQQIALSQQAKIGSLPVAVPMVDMHTIGAGGGSIASVDAGGLLLVGPESAGASPGPACYGAQIKAQQGEQEQNAEELMATVTDANLALRRLLPNQFLGGDMPLDVDAAEQAIQPIADLLGVTLAEAAQGIIDVVNDHMVRALHVMSVQRGENPADYLLVSFGGAGGLHVCALADALCMRQALVPVNSGVLSALGMLVAEPVRERSRTLQCVLLESQPDDIRSLFNELQQQAEQDFNEDERESLSVQRSVDLRYLGQSHYLNLPWQADESTETLAGRFHELHEAQYGHRFDMPVELVNLRLRLVGRAPEFELPDQQNDAIESPVFTQVAGIEQPVPVYHRSSLKRGVMISGPALITETTATTWLAPGWWLDVDSKMNLLLKKQTFAVSGGQ